MNLQRSEFGPYRICSGILGLLVAGILTGCGPKDEPREADDSDPSQATQQSAPELEGSQPDNRQLDNTINPMNNGEIDPPQLSVFAEAEVEAVGANNVAGRIRFVQHNDLMKISGEISGLAPGPHGLHIHETGDCSGPGSQMAGEHFTLDEDPHGSPNQPDALHHLGDLGNIHADERGIADFELVDPELRLGTTAKSIIGRAIVIHANADNFVTQPDGDSGAGVVCAVIVASPRPTFLP